MSLWSDVHRIATANPDGSPREVAREYLTEIGQDELIDLLADAITQARRHSVRAVERETFTPLPVAEESQVEGFEEHVTRTIAARRLEIPRESFLKLLDRTFTLWRGGPVVRWGEATVAQHQQRIEMLEAFVTGTLATIDHHRKAVLLIEAEGASCLNAVIRPQLLTP